MVQRSLDTNYTVIIEKYHRMKQWQMIIVVLLLCSGWLPPAAIRAERDRPVRIGALTASWGPTPMIVGLRDGLLELGYREDEDFVLGVRFTQGDLTALTDAARELISYEVDLIFASEDAAAIAARQATRHIPVGYTGVSNPVEMGLVRSFATPSGNVTGVTDFAFELTAKRLELFQKMMPNLQRILVPYDANSTTALAGVKAYRDAARRLGIVAVERPVRTMKEAQETLAQVHKGEVDGIVQWPSPALNIAGFILEATTQRGIPAIFAGSFWAERGALATYGPDFHKTGKQAARLVDKILKGANPATIPVEVNSNIEFIINLKTAQALGLTIPPEILFQATKVIH